jgi:hypothetical protein
MISRQKSVSQPQQHLPKSSYLKTSLTANNTYNLAKVKKMLCYLFNLSFLKTKQNQ